MARETVLLAGESGFSAATHIAGFDQVPTVITAISSMASLDWATYRR